MTEDRLQVCRTMALRLWMPCHLSHVRPAALRVSSFLSEQGMPAVETQACELALVEACNNAVDYATPAGRQQRITVEVFCEPAAVEMHVRDHGPGFTWPEQVSLPPLDRERGRGLFLIQSLMDEARYFSGAGENCLVLRKNRSQPGDKWIPSHPILGEFNGQRDDRDRIIGDMAEELSFCYESLSAIFRSSAELGRTHNLKEFAQRLLTDLAQILSADWFVLRLLSKDGNSLELFTASEGIRQLPPAPLIRESSPVPLEAKAASTRQDIWFEANRSPQTQDPLAALLAEAGGLIHPFSMGDQLMGTLTVGKTAGHPQFTAVQANIIHTFADFLGIQITNARFEQEQVQARLVSRELEIARNIQRSLLPKSLPQLPIFRLAGFCQSAQQVGGDFYDVVRFNDTSLLLVIADVMGKGLPAAMFAAILRSLLRAAPEWSDQPAHLLSRVNRLLFKELSGVDMFITAQLAFVDTGRGQLTVASAGHCPLLLRSAENAPIQLLAPEGLPLGIVPDTLYRPQVEAIGPASRLLLYTDGLTEARSPGGELFGQDRLVAWFRSAAPRLRTAVELKEELSAELSKFQSSAAIQDDQTFLVMA